jgi:hypothetical protein
VVAGASEYACRRMECGDFAEWSFGIDASGGNAGLTFTVRFFAESSSGASTVCSTRQISSRTTGSHRAGEAGLLWLEWSNPGTWSRTKKVYDLRLGLPSERARARRDRGSTIAGNHDLSERQRSRPLRQRQFDCFGCVPSLFAGCSAPGSERGRCSSSLGSEELASAGEPDASTPMVSRDLCTVTVSPKAAKGAQQSSTLLFLLAMVLLFLTTSYLSRVFDWKAADSSMP